MQEFVKILEKCKEKCKKQQNTFAALKFRQLLARCIMSKYKKISVIQMIQGVTENLLSWSSGLKV